MLLTPHQEQAGSRARREPFDSIVNRSAFTNGGHAMVPIMRLAATVVIVLLATNAFAQDDHNANAIGEASPYVAIENEPAPKLIVNPTPLAAGLALGIVWIQYRVENVHIVPVFGAGGLNVSPRIGHLHVHLDDLPWGWVEASDNNTISVAGLPPGQHKMLVELVDPQHHVFAGCAECRQTVNFTVPDPANMQAHQH
jgi:hypothetical protein